MLKSRARLAASMLAGALISAGLGAPATTAALEDDLGITAVLDGKPIPLKHVAKYYCDDFSYPVIQCSVDPGVIEARELLLLSLTAVDYVTMYDLAGYAGSWMHVSQDYNQLWLIGWSDKVSSFRGRNSETGRFWTDWFNSGASWSFCCNSNVSSLGSYNNTFSSVQRT